MALSRGNARTALNGYFVPDFVPGRSQVILRSDWGAHVAPFL